MLSCSQVAGLKVARSQDGVWSPPDLNAVTHILDGILLNKMTPENRKFAEHVAEDVKANIASLVNGKNLSMQAKREKINSAISEMEGLRQKLEPKPLNMTLLKLRMEADKKELSEKKAELERDEKAIKVMKLKKLLMEKKLQLEKLMEEKMQAKNSKTAMATDAKAQNELLAKLEQVATEMTKVKGGNATGATASMLTLLKARSKMLSDTIGKMDADEKQRNSKLQALADKKLPAKKDDPLAKGQAMLKNLNKEEHRKFEKARALKKTQLAELDSAIRSLAKGDVAGLKKSLQKMQAEVKALDAKTGSFLY